MPTRPFLPSVISAGLLDCLSPVGRGAEGDEKDLDLAAMIRPVPASAKFNDPDYHI